MITAYLTALGIYLGISENTRSAKAALIVCLIGLSGCGQGLELPGKMVEAFPWCDTDEHAAYCAEAYEANGDAVFTIPVDSWNG